MSSEVESRPHEVATYDTLGPDQLGKRRRDRIYRQLTHHMRTFGSKDVWGETFNPWADPNYKAQK